MPRPSHHAARPGRCPAAGTDLGGRRGGRRGGDRLLALLSAAARPAGGVVRGQSELPSHSRRLWLAVGHAGGEGHPRPAGFRGRDGPGQGPTRRRRRRLTTSRRSCAADAHPPEPGGRRRAAARRRATRLRHERTVQPTSSRRTACRRSGATARGAGPAAGLARPARLRSAAAACAGRRRLSKRRARCCGTRGPITDMTRSLPMPWRITIISATMPGSGVAGYLAAQRRLHPLLLPHAYLGDA